MRTAPLALAKKKCFDMGSRDRGIGQPEYAFQSNFGLADLQSLQQAPQKPSRAHKYLGGVAGFPVAVLLKHEERGMMGAYIHVKMPPWQESHVRRSACFVHSLKLEQIEEATYDFFVGLSSRGWFDFFNKPWGTIVCPDSPYFPKGMLAVQLTMRPSTEQNYEEDEEDE